MSSTQPNFFSSLKLRILMGVVFCASLASAHAILLNSTPSTNQTLHGDHFDAVLHYNSRVDGARSQLTLISVDGSKRIPLEKQTDPDKLLAHVTDLKPGSYRLVWQVLASDGHLTRGQIPFKID
jgi:copper resistance protein C